MADQSNEIIAFQGVPGANSDLACRRARPYLQTKAYPSFKDVLHAVESGEVSFGMIPLENSMAGRVSEFHNLLPDMDLYIVGEYFLPVEHFLFAPEGATLETVKTVYSHPQALMQCRESLHALGLQGEAYSNTAAAAADVQKWNDPTKAALASPLAGELYGLKCLKENLEDTNDNTTIFVIVAKEPAEVETNKLLTSLLFTARNIPAALYKALGGFATNHVNLLKLESYIPGGNSATAQFFITLEGSSQEKNVQLAIEELGFFCRKVKVLGVYPAAPEREL